MEDLNAWSVGPSIDIRFNMPPPLLATWFDPGQLGLALLDLCVNARDDMEGRGQLTLDIASSPSRKATHHGSPRALPPGPFVSISVRNKGCGMDPAPLLRAAEHILKTRPVGQGAGLGLAMGQALAQQSGGALLINSAVACGTAITILLPSAPVDFAVVGTRQRTSSDIAGGRPDQPAYR